ncbi:unnamed protein product, partial [marine sediment metagenome]
TYDVYDGEVVRIQAGAHTFTQTEDHQLYAVQTSPADRTKYRSWDKAFQNIHYDPCWVNANELKPGDFLLVKKPQKRSATLDRVIIDIKKTRWRQYIDRTLEIPLNEEFGELIGLYLAEGYARSGGQMGLCYSGDEEMLHKKSAYLIKKYFQIESRLEKHSKSNSAQVVFNEICIAAFLRNKLGCSCYKKHIPEEWMKKAPLEFMRGILWGYLHGDGTVSQPRTMGYSTTSCLLAMQIQQVAMELGIFFGVTTKDGSTEEQP